MTKKATDVPQQNFKNYDPRIGFRKIRDTHKRIFEEAKAFNKDSDNKLLICTRGNEFHIYYRGGKILGIKSGSLVFDAKYLKRKDGTIRPFPYIKTKEGTDTYVLDSNKVNNSIVDFFKEAAEVMDGWFADNSKQERDDQHSIALANPTTENGLAVVDIEFATSFNANYYNREYIDAVGAENGRKEPYRRYPNPRFDIVAIDQNGRLHVIELKTGLSALSNAEKHVDDFNNLIGNEEIGDDKASGKKRFESFNEEIQMMIESLNGNNLRPNKLPNVNMSLSPVFHFAFTSKEKCEISPEEQIKSFSKKIQTALKKGVDIIEVDSNFSLHL